MTPTDVVLAADQFDGLALGLALMVFTNTIIMVQMWRSRR